MMILVTNSVSVSFLKQSKEEYFEKQILGTDYSLSLIHICVQASDTLPELTKDNALEQMMKAGETDSRCV